MPAPPSKYPRFGGSKKDKKSISKISRACNPIEIIPNRWTKEPNFAVACLIHLLTQRPRNRALKTRRGLVISFFTNVRKKKFAETLRRVKIEITSPLRVFSWRFRERWVRRCMRHATAKFGCLVHRFGMISVGLHAHEFIEIDFWSFLDPPYRGYFEGGAGNSAQIWGDRHRENPPYFLEPKGF